MGRFKKVTSCAAGAAAPPADAGRTVTDLQIEWAPHQVFRIGIDWHGVLDRSINDFGVFDNRTAEPVADLSSRDLPVEFAIVSFAGHERSRTLEGELTTFIGDCRQRGLPFVGFCITLWLWFRGYVFVVVLLCFFVVVRSCFCGGVFVFVLLCFCGGVVVFLWWRGCVFVVALLIFFCDCVFGVVWLCFCGCVSAFC